MKVDNNVEIRFKSRPAPTTLMGIVVSCEKANLERALNTAGTCLLSLFPNSDLHKMSAKDI